MPANVYEYLFILDSSKLGGDIASADRQLRSIVEKHGAEVLVSRPWDERRLAYPIRNQKKGLYWLLYLSSEGKNLHEIERDCAITEIILRMIVIKIDPKLVDTMLALAKGEHATALHNYQDDPADVTSDHRGPRERREPAAAAAAVVVAEGGAEEEGGRRGGRPRQ